MSFADIFYMNEKGFTLFEGLLAAVLFVLGFLALSQAITVGLVSGSDNESRLVALQLAQEKMEEVRAKTYASVASEARAAVSGFSTYEREAAVTTPQTNLKQVSVKVYWFHKDDELSEELVTYVSN